MNHNTIYSNPQSSEQFINLITTEINQHPSKEAYGFVGIIGSKNIQHDIDVLFYPSASIQTGQFIKKHSEFLKYIKERMQYNKSDLIPFPMLAVQEEVEYISKRTPNQILLHNLIFVNEQHITEQLPFFNSAFQNSCETIYGDKNVLKNTHSTNLDFYYFTLINSFTLLSNYPNQLQTNKTKHICSYVSKHALNTPLDINSSSLTLEDNTKILFDTLDGLDAIAKRA